MVIVVTISLSNCSAIKEKNYDSQILFIDGKSNVELKKGEFTLTENSTGFDLEVLNSEKLLIIKKLKNLTIKVISKENKFIAKGNNIFNSGTPNNSNYFFPIDSEQRLVFFKQNIISIKKVHK